MQQTADIRTEDTVTEAYRFGFILQQVLGWVAAYKNLRMNVDRDPTVSASWTEVTFTRKDGLIERIPLVPTRVSGTLRGILQVHEGLGDLPFTGTHPAYDAVLFNGHALCLSARRFMRRVPSVVATDVTPMQLDAMAEYYDLPVRGDTRITRYRHRFYSEIFQAARVMAPWSDWAGRSLVRDYGVPEEHVVVIPPGVDVERWAPPEPGTREASLERSGGRPRILFVGGHFERKGGKQLLEWFFARGHDHCELDIVTRTPPKLAEQVPHLRIHTGLETNDPRLTDLYRNAHIFVLPTLADCFGVASIEAMATGLPVITTAVGGVPEIVDDGVQGYLVPPGDAHALGQRLDLLVADGERRATLGNAGRAKVLARFDARQTATAMLTLMKQIAHERVATVPLSARG